MKDPESDIQMPTARGETPKLQAKRIGVVSRHYRHRYANERRDFSHVFGKVLTRLDNEGCDTVLFSLYTLDIGEPSPDKSRLDILKELALRNIRTVLMEEF
jgi:hypothetical protein